jgi:peptidoglycan/xylan/chitin deacetylase (PgdA/CDA1 family)
MTGDAGRLRHWMASPAMRFSFWLHGAAALSLAAVAFHAAATGSLAPAGALVLASTLALLVLDHVVLTAAGLCPRCNLLGPNITRLPEQARRQGMIAITIDDGPDPLVTPQVLDMLRDADATASFFLIARKAEQYPALVARIAGEGHSVENHSWSHSHTFAFSGPRRFRAEIGRAQQSLARLSGEEPRFFRAPAGMRNPLLQPVLSDLGLPLTSWTRRGFDTVKGDPRTVLDGHAALAPDGRAVILSVLPQLLGSCRRRGLQPVSLKRAMQA